MTKFMKIEVNGSYEYFNTSNILATEKAYINGVTQVEIMYSSIKNPGFKLQEFGTSGKSPDYLVEAIMASNSTSHTSNVYIPELKQGSQPRIDNIV